MERTTASRRQARKVITVLFSDVTGFTPLSERVDSEALNAVMERYTAAMTAVVTKHGGRVERFIGDAVMATFGLPAVREDDASRAVRAALEINDALREVSAQLPERLAIELTASTGINTGEVFVNEDEITGTHVGELVGDPVNVAARLESAAGAGEVLLGELTYRLVRDGVDADRVELALKGKRETVIAYRVRGIAPDPRARRELAAPTIGREREAQALAHAFGRAVESASCVIVRVTGEAGAGKSRLVRDMLESAQGRARTLVGRCLPYGEATPFWPVAEMVCAAAGISQEDEPEVIVAAISRLLAGESDEVRLPIASRLAGALGLGPIAGAAEEIGSDISVLLRSLAAEQPLIAAIEDIHWAGPPLMRALGYVAETLTGTPVMLLCSSRPEGLGAEWQWPDRAEAIDVPLGRLSEDATTTLVSELLDGGSAATRLAERIHAVANGNPLVVEEVLGMLIDEEMLSRDDDGWQLLRPVDEIRIPPAIEAILAARLDRLSREEREVLEAAAVVGKDFDIAEVSALAGIEGQRLVDQLGSLLERQLIVSGTAVAADYSFHHMLVRDAAYTSTPKRRRARLHEQFADHLEHSPGGRSEGPYGEIIGEHLFRACELGAELGADEAEIGELARRAGLVVAGAADRAMGLSDFAAASRICARGEHVLQSHDPLRATLLTRLAEATMDLGEPARAGEAARAAIDLAEKLGRRDLVPRPAALLARVEVTNDIQAPAAAIASMRRIAGEVELTGDARATLATWIALGSIMWVTGQMDEALDLTRRQVILARAAAPDQLPYVLVGHCGTMVRSSTPIPAGLAQCEGALGEVQRDTLHAAMIECHIANLESLSGDADASQRRYDLALATCERYDTRLYASIYRLDRGCGELLAGRFEAAESTFARAIELCVLDAFTLAEARALHARARVRLGDVRAGLDEAVDAGRRVKPNDADGQIWWRVAAALAQAQMGRIDRAEGLAREAVGVARTMQCPMMLADSLACLGEVLLGDERTDAARAVLEEARRVYAAKGMTTGVDSVRGLLMQCSAEVV